MKNINKFSILFFVFFLLLSSFSVSAMMEDKSINDLDDIKRFKSAFVIIPTRVFEKENITDYLINLKNGDVSKDSYDDLNSKDKLFLKEKIDLENKLLTLNSKLNSISQKQKYTIIENSCGSYNGD